MIRYEIYPEQKSIETNSVIRIKLTKTNEGIRVEAVDAGGERYPQGSLLQFEMDGTIRRYMNIDKGIGFKLNRDQQIEIK